MTGSRIVLVDSDAHTSSLLLDELGRRGFGSVDTAPGAATLPLLLAGGEADIVIVNHRYQDHGALAACNMVRRIAPECATVVVTASGPALQAVRAWARQSLSIDLILKKPFIDDSLLPGARRTAGGEGLVPPQPQSSRAAGQPGAGGGPAIGRARRSPGRTL